MLRSLIALGIVAAGLASACRTPTQVTLEVTTDARCLGQGALSGDLFVDVGVAVGPALGKDDLASRGGDDRCEPLGAVEDRRNWLGDLVVVPGEAEGNTAEVVVVAGVERTNPELTGDARRADADTCLALLASPGGVDGKACIVSRRIVGFVTHEKLTLPVLLSTRCVGVDCGEDETCSDGTCVTARVVCDAASGACARPEGEGGGGQGGAGGTGGAGGADPGCDDATCAAECASSGTSGACVQGACTCVPCVDTACNAECAALGQGVEGTCDGDACVCRAACDDVACADNCPAGRAGQCDVDGRCLCAACDEELCADDCAGADLSFGVTNCAGEFQCVCGASCTQNAECAAMCDGSLGLAGFCNQNVACQCVCVNVRCEEDCVAKGLVGGACTDSACVCSACPASCTEAPCNGTCTDDGCTCAG